MPFAVAVMGCGISVQEPPRTQHRAADFEEVPYPPPAALAELVPPAPNDDAVWVDGEWEFRGSFYGWRRGGWVLAPRGARYAPWRIVFQRDGRLLFAPGAWYDEHGRRIEPPPVIVAGRTPPNEFIPERRAR